MSEQVRIDARLIGNNTGNVYCVGSMEVQTIFKQPDLYVGDEILAIPFYPVVAGGDWPELDPADTEIILQFRTNSANTRLGRDTKSPFLYIGHWRGWIDVRARGVVEIPNGGVS